MKYLMLCSKTYKREDNTEFEVLFAYRQNKNTDGTFSDVMTPAVDKEGKSIMIAKSTKVVISKELLATLKASEGFPYRITLDENHKDENGNDDFYVTYDKDKDGHYRLDNKGNKRAVIVIRRLVDFVHVAKVSLTLDDIDNI